LLIKAVLKDIFLIRVRTRFRHWYLHWYLQSYDVSRKTMERDAIRKASLSRVVDEWRISVRRGKAKRKWAAKLILVRWKVRHFAVLPYLERG
jgi:hypothetical protein